MTRRKKCAGPHRDRYHRDGSRTCTECGDHFPCRGTCTHVDCADERARLAAARKPRAPRSPDATPLEAAILGIVEVKP